MNKSIKGNTFADCYRDLLHNLLEKPEYVCAPRGMQINEITDLSFTIENPQSCLYDNKRRGSQSKYIAAEFIWYFAGRRDLQFIERYASFWKHVANPDGTLNSAYGHLLFNRKNEHGKTQWEWAYDSLIADKDTRQAIMHFNTPDHQRDGNKDFVCTLSGNFHIRENKLNLTINMRSNDAILGTATDVAFFCVLQIQMWYLLQEKYPDLELGTYTHFVHSMHIYERHFELVKEMLAEEFIPVKIPLMEEDLVDTKGNPSKFVIAYSHYLDEGHQQPPVISLKDISAYNNSLELWIETNLTTG